jgi:hypothetical protein
MWRRTPGFKPVYNNAQTRRYKSAHTRWQLGQSLPVVGVESVGSQRFVLFSSARSASGFWRVLATVGSSGPVFPAFSTWISDPTPYPTDPWAPGHINFYRYVYSSGASLVYNSGVPYVEGDPHPSESTGEEEVEGVNINVYSPPFPGTITPPPPGFPSPTPPYWANRGGYWAMISPVEGGGLLYLGTAAPGWNGSYPPPPWYEDDGGGGGGGDGPITVVSCDCPDYTKEIAQNPRSPWRSEQRSRTWATSRAGTAGMCKHMFATRKHFNIPTIEPRPDNPLDRARWQAARDSERALRLKRRRAWNERRRRELAEARAILKNARARDRAEMKAIRNQLKGIRQRRSAAAQTNRLRREAAYAEAKRKFQARKADVLRALHPDSSASQEEIDLAMFRQAQYDRMEQEMRDREAGYNARVSKRRKKFRKR